MSLPVSSIVQVSASIVEQGLLRREFGISLFLTTDTTLPGGAGRVQTFADFSSVTDVFAVGTEPFEAANIYFQQSPFPKNLVIGRFIDADIAAVLFGGVHTTLSAFQAISDGTFTMFFDGVEEDITAVDFSGDSSFADVAATLDAKLTTAAVAYDVTYDAIAQSFVITGTALGDGNTLTFATPEGTGTDISGVLGWTSATGGVLQQGQDAETVEEAITAILALDNSWYFITLETTLWDTQTVLDVSAFIAALPFMFFADSTDLGVLTTGETTSNFALISALAPDRTVMTWSRTADYKGLSAAARLGSTNYAGSNTVITLKFKKLPGTLSDNISSTQKAELDSKNVNGYFIFSTVASQDAIYAEGSTAKPGVFADVRAFVDFFVDAIQVSEFNLLVQSPNKVPQTPAGVAALESVASSIGNQGITNGGIAPGQLSAALTLDVQQTTGVADFDGFLVNGFLIFTTPLADQSQSDRNQRKAPPMKIWLKGSGAFHFIDIAILFEN